MKRITVLLIAVADNDGKPVDDAFMKTCFPCHQKIKERDLVFTRYAP